MFLDKLNIDTLEVLNASKTKWNFIPFTPGLVALHWYRLLFNSQGK